MPDDREHHTATAVSPTLDPGTEGGIRPAGRATARGAHTALLEGRVPEMFRRRTRARRVFAVLAVILSATATLTLAPTAAGEQEHSAQSTTVPIRDFVFMPPDLMVNTGDTVNWVNEDQAPHNVTTQSAPAQFASDTLKKGQSFSYTFAAPGTYSYVCTIHPDMTATVTAMDHAAAAAAPPPEEAAPPADDSAAAGASESVPDESVSGESPSGESAPAEAAPDGSQPGAPAAPGGAAPAPGAAPVLTGPASTPGTTQAVGAAQGKQLNPMLIVAAIALGVAVLCLLLVTSRTTERG